MHMEKIGMQEAAGLLLSWNNILILSHRSPDGDTLGAASALLRALLALGKRARFECADAVPEKFSYMFFGVEQAAFEPDRIVTVDVADAALLGALEEAGRRADLSIDHHAANAAFAAATWVKKEAAATCEMMAQMLPLLGAEITPEIADCLYTGITTDTGCFRYPSATPETYRVAADMMERGARAAEINRVMFDTKSRAAVELLKRVYSDMEFFCDGRCAVLCLTEALLRETGVEESDLDGTASIVRQVEGVVFGATIREREDGEFKVSLRAMEPADAAAVCRRFGGGGHKGAGGCSFRTSMEDAKAQLVAACGEALNTI